MTTPFDCPRCGTTLAMSERQGIEIDYWPACRGVWLDRGELDKLIERADAPSAAAPTPSAWAQPPPTHRPQPRHDRDDRRGQPDGHKRKSWLKEIFD
jgi:Zn-finger nucleic acid-binding protein